MKIVATLIHNSRSPKYTTNSSTPTSSECFSQPATPLTSHSGNSGCVEQFSSCSHSEPYITEACCSALIELVKTAWVLRSTTVKPLDDIHHPTIVEMLFESSTWIFFDGWVPNVSAKIRRYQSHLIDAFEKEWNVQLVFQGDSVFRRYKRLAVFDMDSTLIQQEVIDEIARKLGVEREVSQITERAMNGELDFTQSLRARCALLRGVPSTVFEELRTVITLTPGAKDLVRALKRLGFKTAVLSGGFTPLTSWQAQQLGLDYAFANHLVVSRDGKALTGELEGEIVNAEKKKELVQQIAEREGIPLDQVIVVGDGANDLPMMNVAGFGLAFNAKPKVQQEASARLNSTSLLDVLYMLGFTREEQEELLK